MKTPKQAKAFVKKRKPETVAEARSYARAYWAQPRNICLSCGMKYGFGIVHDCEKGER